MILSDGDLLTLANMRLNLELNGLIVEVDKHKTTGDPKNKVSLGSQSEEIKCQIVEVRGTKNHK